MPITKFRISIETLEHSFFIHFILLNVFFIFRYPFGLMSSSYSSILSNRVIIPSKGIIVAWNSKIYVVNDGSFCLSSSASISKITSYSDKYSFFDTKEEVSKDYFVEDIGKTTATRNRLFHKASTS